MANGNFGGGVGSVELPYLIEDGQDLIAMRNNRTAFYKLKNNINMSGLTYTTPPGNMTGGFNGDGYKISNLSLVIPNNFLGILSSNNVSNFTLECSVTGTSNVDSYAILSQSPSGTASYTLSNIHLIIDINASFGSPGATTMFATITLSNYNIVTDSSVTGNAIIRGIRNSGFSGNAPIFIGISRGNSIRCFTNINTTLTASYVSGDSSTYIGVSDTNATDCYSSGTIRAHTIRGISNGTATRCYSNIVPYAAVGVNGISSSSSVNCFFLGDKMYRSAGSSANLANFRIIGPTVNNCYAIQGVQLLHEA